MLQQPPGTAALSCQQLPSLNAAAARGSLATSAAATSPPALLANDFLQLAI